MDARLTTAGIYVKIACFHTLSSLFSLRSGESVHAELQ